MIRLLILEKSSISQQILVYNWNLILYIKCLEFSEPTCQNVLGPEFEGLSGSGKYFFIIKWSYNVPTYQNNRVFLFFLEFSRVFFSVNIQRLNSIVVLSHLFQNCELLTQYHLSHTPVGGRLFWDHARKRSWTVHGTILHCSEAMRADLKVPHDCTAEIKSEPQRSIFGQG